MYSGFFLFMYFLSACRRCWAVPPLTFSSPSSPSASLLVNAPPPSAPHGLAEVQAKYVAVNIATSRAFPPSMQNAFREAAARAPFTSPFWASSALIKRTQVKLGEAQKPLEMQFSKGQSQKGYFYNLDQFVDTRKLRALLELHRNATSGEPFEDYLQPILRTSAQKHGFSSMFWISAKALEMKAFGAGCRLKQEEASKGTLLTFRETPRDDYLGGRSGVVPERDITYYNAEQTTQPEVMHAYEMGRKRAVFLAMNPK